jgi:hypothetical protein
MFLLLKETAQIHVLATVSFFSNICFGFSHTDDQLNLERLEKPMSMCLFYNPVKGTFKVQHGDFLNITHVHASTLCTYIYV